MKKTLVILVAILIFLFSFTASSYATEIKLTDVKTTDWYYKNLQELVQKNIASGYPDGTFKPGNTLKFEEFIKMLVVAVEGEQVNQKVEHEWYQIYIDKAIESKYITEQQKSLIAQNIDRQTMAEILYNILVEKEKITTYTDADFEYLSNKLTDISKTDVKTLTINAVGIISGYPDRTFKPKGILTRAEAIVVISRVINPELRNPVKIVKRDANGVIDSKDLDKIPVAQAGYDINGQVQYGLNAEKNYKVQNVIKIDTSMFPIKFGGLVITGIEKLSAEDAPWYGDTSIAWGGANKKDAIVIHGYAVEKSNNNGVETGYSIAGGLDTAFINKSRNVQMKSVAKMITSYGGKDVYDKTKKMFHDYALGEDAEVKLNQQFTIMVLSEEGFELENITKFIFMDVRSIYYPEASTYDILEIDTECIQKIK